MKRSIGTKKGFTSIELIVKLKKSDNNLITLRKEYKQNLFELKNKSSIYQYEFNGGVAQLVRARDS